MANEENSLKIQFSVCIDNFEQYFDTSFIITQNDFQFLQITNLVNAKTMMIILSKIVRDVP